MSALHIAFFGHNVGDSAVRRRAIAFQRAGFEVTGFMPHRGKVNAPPWHHIELGETHDNAYIQRIIGIFSGSQKAMQHAKLLRRADVLYARNLDMLALAQRVRRRLGLSIPLVYECLDIHHRLSGSSMSARLLRQLERHLLASCALVIVSSPRFDTDHFSRYYPQLCKVMVVENRLIEGDVFADRPNQTETSYGTRLRIGWFGNLRCRRSLTLLLKVAQRFPNAVDIVLRGYPAPGVFADFEGEIAPYANVHYYGRYHAPQDLADIYSDIDVIWAGDWYEDGANSLWLLPNRIYEGGYFATPALAPAGTETSRWIADNGAGFVIDEPIEQTLETCVSQFIEDRAPLAERCIRLLGLPRSTFVEDTDTVRRLFDAAGVKNL